MVDLQYIAGLSDVDLQALYTMVEREKYERHETKHKRAWEDVRKAIVYYIQNFGTLSLETVEDIIPVDMVEDLLLDVPGTIGIKCDDGDNW